MIAGELIVKKLIPDRFVLCRLVQMVALVVPGARCSTVGRSFWSATSRDLTFARFHSFDSISLSYYHEIYEMMEPSIQLEPAYTTSGVGSPWGEPASLATRAQRKSPLSIVQRADSLISIKRLFPENACHTKPSLTV
jgi:hypothetical protein